MPLPWVAIGAAVIGATLYELAKLEPENVAVDNTKAITQKREKENLNEVSNLLEVVDNIGKTIEEIMAKHSDGVSIEAYEYDDIKDNIDGLRESIAHCKALLKKEKLYNTEETDTMKKMNRVIIAATIQANEMENRLLLQERMPK